MDRSELKYLLLVAVLFTLSFPPFQFGFLAPLAIAIFLIFLQSKGPRDGFRLGYWLGLFWGAMTLFWISESTVTGALITVLLNSFQYAIIWWLYIVFREKNQAFALFSFPFLWVGFEYIRQFSDIRFNWLALAHTQTYYLHFIQFIEYTGYLGLSFLVICLGISFYMVVQYRGIGRWVPLGVALLLVVSVNVFGQFRIHQLHEKKYNLIKAGLVQPNVDPYLKWDLEFQNEAFRMLMQANHQLADEKPNLIVWPETATPFYLRANPTKLAEIQEFLDSTHIFLLTGTPDYQYGNSFEDYRTYNAAFFMAPGHKGFEYYYKTALVPGSETIPFKTYFPFLRHLDVGGGDFFPGHEYTVFNFSLSSAIGEWSTSRYVFSKPVKMKTKKIGLSAVICYESVFPDIVRHFVHEGANILAIITNDGWFGVTSGPYQHAQFAVLRAIENRISILRCANTGISSLIDPTGRIIKKAGLNTRKDLVAYVPVNDEKSFFTRHGDLLGKFTLLMSFALILFKLIRWHVFKN